MKILVALFTLFVTSLALPFQIVADDPGPGSSLTEFNEAIGLKNGTNNADGINLTTVNGIISTILPIGMTFAGIILLFMLISGGFTMMTSFSDPKGADAGKQRITAALTGFFLLFLSYWIIQLLEVVLGVTILG